MHALMVECKKHGVPFYLENPATSKLWHHPIIKKWVQSSLSQIVIFDYCQYGTEWRKPTQVLAYNNVRFNQSIGKRCCPIHKVRSLGYTECSRSGKAHTSLTGTVKNPNGKGKIHKTAVACPYPEELCRALAPILIRPTLNARGSEAVTTALTTNV
jgi:hypothetical protein